MSVTIQITCHKCGAVAPPVNPYSRRSRWGTLRAQAALPTGWYVDGNGGYCPDHKPTEATGDHWQEYDLQHAYELINEHEAEVERCRGCR